MARRPDLPRLSMPPWPWIEVAPEGGLWRLRSSDALFGGLFTDQRAALRHAWAEADCHPGHLVVLRAA